MENEINQIIDKIFLNCYSLGITTYTDGSTINYDKLGQDLLSLYCEKPEDVYVLKAFEYTFIVNEYDYNNYCKNLHKRQKEIYENLSFISNRLIIIQKQQGVLNQFQEDLRNRIVNLALKVSESL